MQELIEKVRNFRITMPRPAALIGWMVGHGVGVHTNGDYSELCFPNGSERFGHDGEQVYTVGLTAGDWRAWNAHEMFFHFESRIGLSPETLDLVIQDLTALPLNDAVRAVQTVEAKRELYKDMTCQEINAIKWYLLGRSHPEVSPTLR